MQDRLHIKKLYKNKYFLFFKIKFIYIKHKNKIYRWIIIIF